jgi:hypothetical protein
MILGKIMPDNIYTLFQNFIQSWQEKLTEEMNKFWGKISINETVTETFMSLIKLLRINFSGLKKGTFTAEKVRDNIREIHSIFQDQFDKLNQEIKLIEKKREEKLSPDK